MSNAPTTINGTFVKGYKHVTGTGADRREEFIKDFELRAPTTDDLMSAEDDAPSNKPLQYNLALAARQLVRIGPLKGPFTYGQLRRGLPDLRDYNALRLAQIEADQLGEE
jgi:hypothetical protein